MWNKIRNTRGFFMALALFCAILCWLFVDVTQEPRTYRTIRDIPVQLVGTETLAKQNLVVDEETPPTLSLTFSGIRPEVSRLNRSNVYVTANLADCKEGEQELSYTISYDPALSVRSLQVKNSSSSRIPVTIVKVRSKTIRVEGVLTGSTAEGYRYNSSNFSSDPENITITGQSSLVQQVDHAQAVLTSTELTETWEGELPLVLVDRKGEEVDMTGLELSQESVNATFPISGERVISLNVTLEEGGGVTAEDVEFAITPQTIRVSGPQEALDRLKGDSFSVGTLDLSQVVTSVKQSFPIELPDGLTNLSSSVSATVMVKLNSNLITRKVVIPKDRIHLRHKPANTNVEILSDDLEVRVRGTNADMTLLLDKDVHAEVDMSDVEEGTIGALTLPARVYAKGMSGVGAIDEPEVRMDLREEYNAAP
jgi:YbbR domain-containing protein